MSEEEKKAIEWIKAQRGKYYKLVIDLLSKKDKVIDLMALHIASSAIVDDMVCVYKDCENENCTADMAIQCTKEYFYKKVEEENE